MMTMRSVNRVAAVLAGVLLPWTAGAETLVIDGPEMAGISGLRAYWDRPVVVAEDGATRMSDKGSSGKGLVADWSTEKPGAPVFDAVHRSLLVRFPGAAEKIGEALKKGQVIQKAEIEFAFVDTEFFPMDYSDPAGMSFMGDLWVKKPPRWHAVAWPLRQPWKADLQLGPTFNASVNGRRYWTHFGAQDEKSDRVGMTFGPTETSFTVLSNRMDITGCFTNEACGKTLAARLRTFSDCGLIVRKWETYDALFNHGGYEYGGAPGHRGIRIQAPRLVVTLGPGKDKLGNVAAAVDVATLPAAGAPTAVMPAEDQIKKWIEQYGFKPSPGMPDWQWQRIQELFKLTARGEGGFPTSVEGYGKWVDAFLAMPYRMFTGHHTTMTTHDCLLYAQAWPAPLVEHMKRYWDAWLLPGRPYTELQHNQWGIWTKEENNYYNKTGDWRGNHSFYRDSYTRFMSTMNFNHNAIIAALLGGAFTGNAEATDDGRFGLETILLRLWGWYDGTTQESIDHYYIGLSLYGQKSFQDLGTTELDRMMGRGMLLKTMDELASCYHPALKRFIATSGRTGVAEMFCINEGVNCILHTVSQKGALHNVTNTNRLGMPIHGSDLPPDLVARQALRGPWLPIWMGNIVDNKPFPFEMTASFKLWGTHRVFPLWKRSYEGKSYGMACIDVEVGNATVPLMAQWRRADSPTADLQEIGTLLMRHGLNRTEFYDSLYHGTKQSNANGSVGTQGGSLVSLQHRNKIVAVTSPFPKFEFPGGRPIPEQITSIQASIALANYQPNPTWKIFIDGQPMGALPVKAKYPARITIQDGLTYLGLIPVPATDLGRTADVVITDGGEPVDLQGGGKAAPTLVINNCNYYNEQTPFDMAKADWTKVDRATSGFVIEMADASDYPSFEAFQKHINDVKLDFKWDDAKAELNGVCTSGPDVMEFGYRPEYGYKDAEQRIPADRCFTYRRVNGKWPYPAAGIERDTTLSEQGTSGRLEKGGAVLCHQPGLMAYLLTEPVSGNLLFANPLPDPQYMTMDAPGGIRVRADGRLGLMHLVLNPKEKRMELNYALKPGQEGADMADALYMYGMDKLQVVRNGRAADVREVVLPDGKAWRIPLTEKEPVLKANDPVAKYQAATQALAAALSTQVTTAARMRYKSDQEHYILTEPENGTWSFWRQWPGESPYDITVPGDVRLATDGNVALQRILVNAKECRIQIDYAPYLQQDKDGKPIKNRAEALLVFGMAKAPAVILHGKKYEGVVDTVTVDGKPAFLIPLFGNEPAKIKDGLEKRFADAMAVLPTVK